MAVNSVPTITALQAQAVANHFLSDRLPDRFTAGQPHFDEANNRWRVPVLLAYAVIGSVGQVGEVYISPVAEEAIASTAIDQMKATAQSLYQQHRDEIEAPVP